MLNLVLALAAAAPTVIDAERAFAQMAQDKGQWTAFRAYAAPDAVMFTPQPVKAHEFLKDRKDPPKAIRWQPAIAWVSCDGTMAVDTGNWQSADGKAVGFFTTVWRRQADGGWKWVYDGGDELKAARPDSPEPRLLTASCENISRLPADTTKDTTRIGASADNTLSYRWYFMKDGRRQFVMSMWNGFRYPPLLVDTIAAPKK